MNPTRAQKFRLGVFVLVSTGVLVATLLMMIGTSFLERRDEYFVRFQGSVGGLEPGSQVRLNGIRVGRVDGVAIDADDPALVRVTLSLDADTPITEDTVATLNMQGITGLKYIELHGATRDSKRLEPGSEIKSGGSDIDLLTEKAVDIALKIDTLLNNLVAATSGENVELLTSILAEVNTTMAETRKLIEDNRPVITRIIANVGQTTDELPALTAELSTTLTEVRATVTQLRDLIDPAQIKRVLTLAANLLQELVKRAGPDELGKVLADADALVLNTDKLVYDANVTLVRLRDDLRRTLEELAQSTENFAEFTQILVEDPAALISGRSSSDRALP